MEKNSIQFRLPGFRFRYSWGHKSTNDKLIVMGLRGGFMIFAFLMFLLFRSCGGTLM